MRDSDWGYPLSHISPQLAHAPCEPSTLLPILAFLEDYLIPTALPGCLGGLEL
jgi:hypothetical protein